MHPLHPENHTSQENGISTRGGQVLPAHLNVLRPAEQVRGSGTEGAAPGAGCGGWGGWTPGTARAAAPC